MRIVVTGSRGLLGGPTANYCKQMGADVLGDQVARLKRAIETGSP